MMVQDVNDGGREGVFGARMVEWCGGGVQYEYGYSTATVVREGVLLLLLCLSPPRLAGSGLAFPLCLAFPVTFDHSASSGIGHWPGSIRLKHTKHTGGSPLCFVCPPTGEDCV